MITKRLHSIFSIVLCLSPALAGAPARADLTVTLHTTTKVASMPDEYAASMKYGALTYYVKVKMWRQDSFGMSAIYDGHKLIMLDTANKTYWYPMAALTLAQQKAMMGEMKAMASGKGGIPMGEPGTFGPPPAPKESMKPVPGNRGEYIVSVTGSPTITITPAAPTNTKKPSGVRAHAGSQESYRWDSGTRKWEPESAKVVDTHQTVAYLGHKVRHYIETTTLIDDTGKMPARMDIYAANDFPPAELAELKAMFPADPGTSRIEGVALETTTTTSGGPGGGMTMKQIVTSISTKPLPASLFAIPSGYRQTLSGP